MGLTGIHNFLEQFFEVVKKYECEAEMKRHSKTKKLGKCEWYVEVSPVYGFKNTSSISQKTKVVILQTINFSPLILLKFKRFT